MKPLFSIRGRRFVFVQTLYILQLKFMEDPPLPLIRKITDNCRKANNKQLYDQAGQLFGKWWMFVESEQFLLLSQTADPNSPNTLMSLAVTYHLDRRPEQVRPVLKRYLELDPANAQALRLGIQTAGLLKDRPFADEVLELMRQHNPAALPLADPSLVRLLLTKSRNHLSGLVSSHKL